MKYLMRRNCPIDEKKIRIDRDYVQTHLSDILSNEDLRRFIL